MEHTLMVGRFREHSVGGRMARLLSDGKPRTVAQIARTARPKSVENILQPGGWCALLRAYGKASRMFTLSKQPDGNLVMHVRKGR